METKKSNLRTQPKQNRALLRVDRILQAAAEVFTECGYDSATTNEIARRADTSIGGLYRVFPDKKAIFLALAQRYLDKVSQMIAEAIVPKLSLPPPELAACFLDLCDEFMKQEPAFAAVFVYADGSPELKETDRHMKRTVAKWLAQLMSSKSPASAEDDWELIARICVEISAAYFRLSLSEPELAPERRKAAFKELIAAYMRPHFAH